ncbi:MAG: Pyruvate synthase subunit PorC [Dehalococcoidia bacterium]|nr:Pyruvate synthase subunit PorC [Chloroflexota bacterium]MBT9165951.1 Pyruvate synthase subunit PorC [Chloroflexota bacterium]
MEKSVILAGFGGQGVILAGKVLAQAGMDHGLEVTWFPSYGPEMRGGTANCTVVLSDEPVASPLADDPTALIAMNLPSLDKFESTVASGGTIVLNSSLIERPVMRADVKVVSIPMNEMAAKVGSALAINMVALGAYIKATEVTPLATVKTAMAQMLEKDGKGKFIPTNEQALEEGYNAA